ncbi:hypothetical protein CLOSTHATH_04595, partial [Hungatella hathewayi DSM 13479]
MEKQLAARAVRLFILIGNGHQDTSLPFPTIAHYQQNKLYPRTIQAMMNNIVIIVAGIKSRIAIPAPKQNSIRPHTLFISSLNPLP